jgi:hypothetical protein
LKRKVDKKKCFCWGKKCTTRTKNIFLARRKSRPSTDKY